LVPDQAGEFFVLFTGLFLYGMTKEGTGLAVEDVANIPNIENQQKKMKKMGT